MQRKLHIYAIIAHLYNYEYIQHKFNNYEIVKYLTHYNLIDNS